ncbi:hypothetical protein [Streptomyces lunaelactis]|uniref:hypothetical protein n=1 Tax=Streptomyces lunaelactis TaxID=1535768 RepID=UPI0035A04795
MCEGQDGIQVHHVRKLADLNKPGRPERPPWVHLMPMRKRKPSWSASPAIRTSTRDGVQLPPGNHHWRAVCRETGPYRWGRGRRKRTRATGTSSAAYFT